MARHYRYMFEGKNAESRSIYGMDSAYEKEKEKSKLAWQKSGENLASNAFADDVEDNDTNTYFQGATWIPSKSAIDI